MAYFELDSAQKTNTAETADCHKFICHVAQLTVECFGVLRGFGRPNEAGILRFNGILKTPFKHNY